MRANTIFLLPLSLFVFFLFFSFIPDSYAYKLVPILAVSNTDKTFLVRLGRQDGIMENMEATFTNDNMSIVGIAIQVTKDSSIWKIAEPNGHFPFIKNQIVTFNFATEKVWLMDPDQYMTYIQDEQKKGARLRALQRRSQYPYNMSFKVGNSMGISETVSVQSSSDISSRNGYNGELRFHRFFKNGFQLGLGFRFQDEIVNSTTITVESKRYLALASLDYYFLPFSSFSYTYAYVGSTIGVGQSQTQVGPLSTKGNATLLPELSLGLEYLFTNNYSLFAEFAWETLNSKERFPSGERQDTSEVNAKISFGLTLFF